MLKKSIVPGLALLMVLLVSSCGRQTTTADPNQAVIDQINSDLTIFSVGDSDDESSWLLSTLSATSEPSLYLVSNFRDAQHAHHFCSQQ